MQAWLQRWQTGPAPLCCRHPRSLPRQSHPPVPAPAPAPAQQAGRGLRPAVPQLLLLQSPPLLQCPLLQRPLQSPSSPCWQTG